MALTKGAQLAILARVNDFMRRPATEKVALALHEVRRRAIRAKKPAPQKMRIRVVYFGVYRRPMYVLVANTRYVAAYTPENLIRKIVLGGWARVDQCKGIARRAFP